MTQDSTALGPLHQTVMRPPREGASVLHSDAALGRPKQDRIRLILLDGYGLFRASLARFLASEPDLEVAGDCGTSAEALEIVAGAAARGTPVDLILLDFNLGAEDGIDFISAARQAGYQGRFLIVAGSADIRNSAIALKLGAAGIFLKSETPDRLIQAIRLVGNDGIWVDRRIIQMLADQLIDRFPRLDGVRSVHSLEGLQQKVLLGIVEGHSNRKIGESLGLTESKIKNTVQRLFGRAGVKTRGQLVRAALEGSLDIGEDRAQPRRQHEPTDAHSQRRPDVDNATFHSEPRP